MKRCYLERVVFVIDDFYAMPIVKSFLLDEALGKEFSRAGVLVGPSCDPVLVGEIIG